MRFSVSDANMTTLTFNKHNDHVRSTARALRKVPRGEFPGSSQFADNMGKAALVHEQLSKLGDRSSSPDITEISNSSGFSPYYQRRRIGWPWTVALVSQHIGQIYKNTCHVPAHAIAVVKSEVALSNSSRGIPTEMPVYDELHVNLVEPSWLEILANLYWRAARRVVMWDVFHDLACRKLVTRMALSVPIDLVERGVGKSSIVRGLLACFPLPYELLAQGFMADIPCQTCGMDYDIAWYDTLD